MGSPSRVWRWWGRKLLGVRVVFLLSLVATLALAVAVSGGVSVPPAVDLLQLSAPPTRQGAHRRLLDVQRAGERLVAVGEMGLVLWSDDGGTSWRQARVPTAVMLTALWFTTPQLGWAVGHDGVVLRSTDAGQTWTKVLDGARINADQLAVTRQQADAITQDPRNQHNTELLEQTDNRLADAEAAVDAGPSRPLLSVRFTDAQTGFIAGSYGQLLRTTDGGQTWSYIGDRLPNDTGLHLNGIAQAKDGAVLIAAEGGMVFRSTDQGQTWQAFKTGYNGQLYGVLPVGDALLAYGFRGHVYRSDDAGQTWQAVPTPATRSLVDARALPDGRWLLVSQSGELLIASADARSFQLVRSGAADLSGAAVDARLARLLTVGAHGLHTVPLSQLSP